MRILVILILSGTLGLLGCDSSSSGSAGSGGSGGTGGSGGGDGGAGGSVDPAVAFCTDYGTICGFDGAGHPSEEACETAYNGYDAERQTCVETHLGLADSTMDTVTHCPHATGAAPCDDKT